jgi:hypothetical protein
MKAIKCYAITVVLLSFEVLMAQAKVVTVGPTNPAANYKTIAAAVNDTTHTLNGDTIQVIESGTFTQNISIGSEIADNLTIDAAEGVTAIIDPTSGLALWLGGDNAGVTLLNLTIRRTTTSDGQTIIVQNGAIVFENVTMESRQGDARGVGNFIIAEQNVSSLSIDNCRFRSRLGVGNGIGTWGGIGTAVPVTVKNSIFSGLDNGAIVGATFTIDNCDFYGGGGGNGMIVDPPGSVAITDSIISNHGTGVFIQPNPTGTYASDYNLYFDLPDGALGGGGKGTRTIGTHDITGQDPLYVDASVNNFRVQETSPALTNPVASAPPSYRGSQGQYGFGVPVELSVFSIE